ncbi:hypothetical protein POM88_048651 [Heracleum sosnowskyi]|uniref:Uncharacterized protein n=1 Tax=Heracleum sosnowskyi TaxID=360622 RepID=A0AAD8LYP0_9APIA|nr:hypothetical protein POM88_048651 [Heracleum sosnowskyi]
MSEANSGKISLRLLVDRSCNRVIIGEAGKDFVDFLFHLISIPAGTVVQYLWEHEMIGSLGSIYRSIKSMPAKYMEPNLNKHNVLNPTVSSSSLADTPFLFAEKAKEEPSIPEVLYQCVYHSQISRRKHRITSSTTVHPYASNDPQVKCPQCGGMMTQQLTYVHSPAKEEVRVGSGSGYVKGLMTYIVMDNLQVMPMSTVSGIALLNTFQVKDLDALETLEVFIGIEEAEELLKASFVTDRVLTHLFLGNQNSESINNQAPAS